MVLDWFRRTFRRSQEEVPESLVALLQPTTHMAREVHPSDALEFYAPFFGVLKDAATEVYALPIIREKNTSVPRNVNYTFSFDGAKISYCAVPITVRSPSNNGNQIYVGGLVIQQPNLELNQAGRFLTRVSEQARLAYDLQGDTLAIFHSRDRETVKRVINIY